MSASRIKPGGILVVAVCSEFCSRAFERASIVVFGRQRGSEGLGGGRNLP